MLAVVAVDGSPESEAAVQFVKENCRPANGELLVLLCRPQQGSAYTDAHMPPASPGEASGQALRKRFPQAQRVEMISAASGSSEAIAQAILDRARQLHASLLCLAPHSRSATERVLVGSVTDFVVRRAFLPVLVVRGVAAAGGGAEAGEGAEARSSGATARGSGMPAGAKL